MELLKSKDTKVLNAEMVRRFCTTEDSCLITDELSLRDIVYMCYVENIIPTVNNYSVAFQPEKFLSTNNIMKVIGETTHANIFIAVKNSALLLVNFKTLKTAESEHYKRITIATPLEFHDSPNGLLHEII